jgi:hypothetical protein
MALPGVGGASSYESLTTHRERAEYWFGPGTRFSTTTDELTPDVMQQVSRALAELAAAAEGYAPTIDANDSGRSILFWSAGQTVTVFIPNHRAAYEPSTDCVLAFDQLWTILTECP